MPPVPCLVHMDRNQLETCILNIVINARDAMPSGGLLTIKADLVDGVPATRHHGPARGPHVAISISDTGSGIVPDALARVFEHFFPTKAPGHGSGQIGRAHVGTQAPKA